MKRSLPVDLSQGLNPGSLLRNRRNKCSRCHNPLWRAQKGVAQRHVSDVTVAHCRAQTAVRMTKERRFGPICDDKIPTVGMKGRRHNVQPAKPVSMRSMVSPCSRPTGTSGKVGLGQRIIEPGAMMALDSQSVGETERQTPGPRLHIAGRGLPLRGKFANLRSSRMVHAAEAIADLASPEKAKSVHRMQASKCV
ncbi:MAG: hypothetical protein ACOH2H_00740 [Cypionkella sp.]